MILTLTIGSLENIWGYKEWKTGVVKKQLKSSRTFNLSPVKINQFV